MTGVDTANDRGPDIPDGSILRSLFVKVVAQTVAAGEYTFMLVRRPGGHAFASNPITGYFATTDPMTQGMIEARKFKLTSPQQMRQVTGALVPIAFRLKWRGTLKINDGDDLVLVSRTPSSTQVFDVKVFASFVHL